MRTTAELRELSEAAANARNEALNSARARLGKTSRAFSEWIKREGLNHAQLIKRYREREFPGEAWENLTEAEKGQVYVRIIRASGRSNEWVTKLSKITGVIGIASIGFLAAITVWDIVEAANPAIEAIKNVWTIAASKGTAVTGEFLAIEAVKYGVAAADLLETWASALAFIGGFAAGFGVAIGAAIGAEALFNLIYGALKLEMPSRMMHHDMRPVVLPVGSPLQKELVQSLERRL